MFGFISTGVLGICNRIHVDNNDLEKNVQSERDRGVQLYTKTRKGNRIFFYVSIKIRIVLRTRCKIIFNRNTYQLKRVISSWFTTSVSLQDSDQFVKTIFKSKCIIISLRPNRYPSYQHLQKHVDKDICCGCFVRENHPGKNTKIILHLNKGVMLA